MGVSVNGNMEHSVTTIKVPDNGKPLFRSRPEPSLSGDRSDGAYSRFNMDHIF